MITTVYDLMQETARRLAGRQNLNVKIQPGGYPVKEAGRHVVATTHNNPFGIPIITMYGSQKAESYVENFLHEIAHAKLHAGELGRVEDNAPLTTPADPALKQAIAGWEYQADSTARRWIKYARLKVEAWQQNDLESLLWALYRAPEGDL